jgi:hypothetical protein
VNVAFPKFVVVRNFYEQLVTEARTVFRLVRKDFEIWLGNALVPLSDHLRSHQRLLERRIENVRKVSGEITETTERCKVLEKQRAEIQRQVDELAQIRALLDGRAGAGDPLAEESVQGQAPEAA